MIIYFNRFQIQMTLAQAQSASHAGSCDTDVKELLRNKKIQRQFKQILPDDIRKELEEYGAWDENELASDSDNQERIIWISACNISEENRK